MSQNHADRNLLMGMIALQMDFIDSSQLIAALRRWMDDKKLTLNSILLDNRVIEPDTAELLTALVDKHLRLHENDAAKSLAALSIAPSVRGQLDGFRDEDIDNTMLLVPPSLPTQPYSQETGGKSESGDRSATTVFQVGEFSSEGARFRVLRFHDKGGIGTVSVAVDGELHREVALKEIQEQFAHDEAARDRFTLEAEITGGLEHPGIVPVYGFGHYTDGRPFYAMRFIRGDNFKDAIDAYYQSCEEPADPAQQAVEFRRLVGRLIDVCHAIQYAHCRGVLHRDLKPGNIMLGKYGETLVVDWGLAKMSRRPESTPLTSEAPLQPYSASGSEQTRQGSHLGTPAYMSPEQAEGRLDLLDARSDVYSLGASLYHLLTGRRPFADRHVSDVLKKVRRGKFDTPRSIRPQTSRALEAVCLKAMAFDPADRYESAAGLAADLENWLADEPVTAWQEPVAVRLRRWVKRHRSLVTSTAATLIAAVVLLSVAVGLLNAAKQREHRERQRAEQNLDLARQAVDVMLTEVASEELENVPQMEEVRGQLLDKARDFYEQFREQTPTDTTLQLQTALAHKRLGDIERWMGEINASRLAYEEGIALLRDLHERLPDEPTYQQQLANSYNYLGVLYKPFDREKAIDIYDQAVELQRDLHQRFPDVPGYRQELARSSYNRGIVHSADSGTMDLAFADFASAIDLLTTAVDQPTAGTDMGGCRQELARCYSNLGILQRSAGELDAARKSYEQAIAIAEPLTRQFPRRRVYKKELALYHNNLSNLLLVGTEQESIQSAEHANQQARQIYRQLSEAVPEIRSELGNIQHSRGVILTKLERTQEAEKEFQAARSTFSELVKEFAEFPRYADRLGNTLYELAKLRYADGDRNSDDDPAGEAFQRACELAIEAIAQHRAALAHSEQNPVYREHLRSDLYLAAWTWKRLLLDHLDAANRAGGPLAAADMAEQLAELSASDPTHLKLAAEVFASCGRMEALPAAAAETSFQQPTEYADRAVQLLRQAIENGYADRAGLSEELQSTGDDGEAFRSLRERTDIQRLIDLLTD